MEIHTKKTILVVEDEEDVLDYLATFLEDSGYNVISANNAKSGLDLAKRHLPDLISLDISMPEESGMSMYCELFENSNTKNIPVIIVTGFSKEFQKLLADHTQVKQPAGYFEKPIEREIMLLKIKEILN
jgi:DNA-binding response OmpR family regulator